MKTRKVKVRRAAVVLFSGGQDSTLVLNRLHEYDYVVVLQFDYGQKHRSELDVWGNIKDFFGLDKTSTVFERKVLKVELGGSSPLVNPNVKLAEYADVNALPGGLEATFVGGRNIVFLALAANVLRAEYERLVAQNSKSTWQATDIYIGVNFADYGGYPDCRPEFVSAMQMALTEGMGTFINVKAPLMTFNKKEIALGSVLSGGFCYAATAYSVTAYSGTYPPTTRDHATLLRERGFKDANIPDPIYVRHWLESGGTDAGIDNYPGLIPFKGMLINVVQETCRNGPFTSKQVSNYLPINDILCALSRELKPLLVKDASYQKVSRTFLSPNK